MAAPQSTIKKHAAYLKSWIKSCNEDHGADCQVDPIAERPPHHIPDWVIDTEDGCIVRGSSVQEYVALSYVWSSAAAKDDVRGTAAAIEDRLMLRKDNLADFCRRGFLRSRILEGMPVVIRDAIEFVRLSGFRYLWVDSLCIVQHDDTTGDRVGLMNEIYFGAYLTIIAAASTEGLFGNEDRDDGHLPKHISASYLHDELLCSHWASRGWTFQEQLLSKRSVVFLDGICFWDCQREVQWHDSSIDEDTASVVQSYWRPQAQQPPSSNRNAIEKNVLRKADRKIFSREESPDLLTSLSPVPDFEFYIELVCRYSNRQLTYDQDVLRAFSGVLEALSRRSFRGGFICGLPALFLDSALLWQPLLKARRRSPAVGTATKIAPMAPLPSWSWAGWQCLVDPKSLRPGLDYLFPWRSEGTFSWRTCKLVDWFAIADDGSVNPVDEPALLQNFKADCEKSSNEKGLPTGWSRDKTGSFVHESRPTTIYRYPLPTQDGDSASVTDKTAALLSCTTTIATLRVRRVLVPYAIARGRAKSHKHSKARFLDTSVFETGLYNFYPDLHDLCPVITLEDVNGRWAGAMALMEDNSSLQSGSEVKMVAISTGSASHEDVAKSYPEKIDSCLDYPFRSNTSYRFRRRSDQVSATVDARPSSEAIIDFGPFASRSESDQPERYHFYNVLWVETIEGVMYRKAAGRIPKEIWELNCGEPTEIVLG